MLISTFPKWFLYCYFNGIRCLPSLSLTVYNMICVNITVKIILKMSSTFLLLSQMPDGSTPKIKKRSSPVKKYEKPTEVKTAYKPLTKPQPLSEREKQKKLKEMMEDAKLRKKDRERNLYKHRKAETQEEESKSYDDDFMRYNFMRINNSNIF